MVLFGTKQESIKNILLLDVVLNMIDAESWLLSLVPGIEEKTLQNKPLETEFSYKIFVLTAQESKGWYFHQRSGEYSSSIHAVIGLGALLSSSSQKILKEAGLAPELEIKMWGDLLTIGFARKLILAAPIHEGTHLINSGKTSLPTTAPILDQSIKVPVRLDENRKPIEFCEVQEKLGESEASYRSRFVSVQMKVPTGPVVATA